MRILFVSDLQLEAGAHLGSGSEFGEGSRFEDQCEMLAQVAQVAEDERVQLVCVLGDVFELRKPSPWAVIAFQDFLHRLLDEGRSVFVLSGNHDIKSSALPSALSIFDGNAEVALVPGLFPVGDVVLAALPWAPMGKIIAKHSGSRAELNEKAAAGLVYAAEFLRERCSVEHSGKQAILLGHWAISGAMLPTGLSIDTTAHEPIIPLDALANAGYNLVAFGHIHKAQVLGETPPMFYCGSPMVCNWGETNDPHGVWLYDSEALDLRFLSLSDRPFFTLEPQRDGEMRLMHTVRGAVVRVRYTATEEEAKNYDHDAIRNVLLDDGAIKVIIQPTITRPERARVTQLDDSLGPDEAMKMWLESQEIVDEQPIFDAHQSYLERL